MGKAHISLARQLIEHLEQGVREFKDKQRDQRKRVGINIFIPFYACVHLLHVDLLNFLLTFSPFLY